MSEIDRYLDELFNRMSGTGAVGRRALAETEDHLRTAADDAVAAGLPSGQAEHEAVTRFGLATMVARQLRSAHRASRLNRALSAGWLLAGLACCGLGVAYLAAAGRLGWSAPDCSIILTRLCYVLVVPPMERAIISAPLTALMGTVLLLGRWLAVRHAGLAPVRRGPAICAGLMIAVAALAAGAGGRAPTHNFTWLLSRPLSHPTYLVIATALLECLAATATLVSPRPRRHAR